MNNYERGISPYKEVSFQPVTREQLQPLGETFEQALRHADASSRHGGIIIKKPIEGKMHQFVATKGENNTFFETTIDTTQSKRRANSDVIIMKCKNIPLDQTLTLTRSVDRNGQGEWISATLTSTGSIDSELLPEYIRQYVEEFSQSCPSSQLTIERRMLSRNQAA